MAIKNEILRKYYTIENFEANVATFRQDYPKIKALMASSEKFKQAVMKHAGNKREIQDKVRAAIGNIDVNNYLTKADRIKDLAASVSTNKKYKEIKSSISTNLKAFVDETYRLAQQAYEWLKNLVTNVFEKLKPVWEKVKSLWTTLVRMVKEAWEKVKSFFTGDAAEAPAPGTSMLQENTKAMAEEGEIKNVENEGLPYEGSDETKKELNYEKQELDLEQKETTLTSTMDKMFANYISEQSIEENQMEDAVMEQGDQVNAQDVIKKSMMAAAWSALCLIGAFLFYEAIKSQSVNSMMLQVSEMEFKMRYMSKAITEGHVITEGVLGSAVAAFTWPLRKAWTKSIVTLDRIMAGEASGIGEYLYGLIATVCIGVFIFSIFSMGVGMGIDMVGKGEVTPEGASSEISGFGIGAGAEAKGTI